MAVNTAESLFAQAMARHGLEPSSIVADSKLHRFDGPGDKRGKQSAWYVLHGDGVPAGAFGHWVSGLTKTWHMKSDHVMTESELIEKQKQLAQLRATEAHGRASRELEAQAYVTAEWHRASSVDPSHAYVKNKCITPFAAKQANGRIIIPLLNSDGVLQSAQYIQTDGSKRFKGGGTITGGFCPIGTSSLPTTPLLICEGWATACSLHEATGYAVVAAMSAGNLLSVSKAMRAKYPLLKIIICGDDDYSTDGNPGRTKAQEAAIAIGGHVSLPVFDIANARRGNDFNDLAQSNGLTAVRDAITSAALSSTRPLATTGPTRPTVLLSCANDITPAAIRWLWPGWLPAGKLTLLAGSPGTGKTTLALAMAAIVSRGGLWPDGARYEAAGNVLMWSSEDDPADTLVPRLIAAGADLRNVHFISNVSDANDELKPFDPSRDVHLLVERMDRMGGARLLILDPIVSAVAGDAHRVNDVRRALQSLVDMASAYQCAVLGISHFAKGGKGTSPAERVIGSQAFVALARMVLVAAKDDSAEKRILARAKSNIARDDGGIAYQLTQVIHEGIEASCVRWGEAIAGSALQILGDVETDPDESSQRNEAASFLARLLSDGPVAVREIKRDADGAGHAWRTIERAKRDLGVKAEKHGMKGGWVWVIPTQGRHEGRDESQFRSNDGLRE